ncbi:hypothetical protein evm_014227 [Chilo suppressalis]|nr:hypothetical protein evm_014227 [Chilo suppressalis]
MILKVSQCGDEEVLSWCSRCCGRLEGVTWVRAAGEGGLPSLLYLWTGTTLPTTDHMLEVACGLPWGRLPVVALEDALERFFQLNYGLASPYHDLPQFK